MSESLPITSGNTALEKNSSEPVVNNVKETLCNDSECAADEHNGNHVSVNETLRGQFGNAAGDFNNVAQKNSQKCAVSNDNIATAVLIENGTTPGAINGIDFPPVAPSATLKRVKQKFKRTVKTYDKVKRNMPRRATNESRPRYAPVTRQIKTVVKSRIAVSNGSNKLNNEDACTKSNDEDNLNKDVGATDINLYNNLPVPSPSPSNAISEQGDSKMIEPDIPVVEPGNGVIVKSGANSTKKNSPAQTTILSSQKKENSPKKSVLSHFQIMRRVLNKKALYGALLVDGMFECPICHVRKEKAQYLLLHLKGHADLTPIFERFQAFGCPMDEIDPAPPDLPKQTCIQDAVDPKTEQLSALKVGLRKKKFKPTGQLGIPILPLPGPQIKRKKLTNNSFAEVQSEPNEIKKAPLHTIHSEMPVVEPSVDPLINPSRSKKSGKRKSPLNSIFKRSSLTESYEEPLNVAIVDVKKSSRLGVSHTRALDPELLDYLKQIMKNKVTEETPHKCKFCGKVFVKGQGIFAHYFKHSRAMASSEMKTDNIPTPAVPLQDYRDGDSAFDDLIQVSDDEDTARNKDTDFLTLQELETNVNRLLRSLVKDTDVLRDLGWPERRVSDLVIEILEKCNLQPAYRGGSRLSQLQCLRENMGRLFRFCIKDEAMERYGWNIKLIDIVVREMIATEGCLNSSRI